MSTTRDPDRLVLFTDAVVAIAITLLVLPLVDIVPEAVAEHRPSIEVITEHRPQILSFLLSFAVIAQYWVTHHRMFQGVKAYTPALVLWNLVWLLTIVFLPFPTEMTASYSDDRFTTSLYIGTILASSVCLFAIALIIHGNPEVGGDEEGLTARTLIRLLTPTALLVIAFLLAQIPAVNYYALLLLLLAPLVSRAVRGRTAASE
ncbi:TMEM175 family protein [Umezawaea sp. Da 62-37]|uniref:TMEM175 family protein n=1 Tax=Umezawaea sp. Da 62-37 TaxID=3075927 RepID=UPI0028F6FE04|nr:TMEM175 family protein [Umezawaea sp. Da 62-37]WNV90407.1 TMEM175 family protein [Umezawaea sp. Da 62-37]